MINSIKKPPEICRKWDSIGAKKLSRFEFEGKNDVWISQVRCVKDVLEKNKKPKQ